MHNPHLPQLGLNLEESKKIADALGYVLSNTFTLYVKLLNYHWHVSGPNFLSLHELFEQYYKSLFNRIDELAERIRTLGFHAPGSQKAFLERANITEDTSEGYNLKANDMLYALIADAQTIIQHIRSVIEQAEKANDHGTADMLTAMIAEHEKMSWLLSSSLEV